MSELRQVAVALGSNLGDRATHLRFASDRLGRVLSHHVVSTFIETVAEEVGPQPAFLNGAVVGQSALSPASLLDELLAIERARGRARPFPGAPRTLDLDLIIVGAEIVSTPRLEVPHPRFRQRTFVLRPLVEIAPGLRDPVTGLSIRELLAGLEAERSPGTR